MRELLQNPLLRMNLAFSCVIWSCAMFNFYLLTFYLKYLPGSIFANSLCFAVSDFLSFFISGSLLKRTDSPNRTLLISFGVSALGSVLYIAFRWVSILVPVFVIISRVGISMTFNTVYISNGRFFPTRFLASSYGLINFVSHLLAVGAPLFAEVPDPLPSLVFLLNSSVGLLCSFFLQDITGKPPY